MTWVCVGPTHSFVVCGASVQRLIPKHGDTFSQTANTRTLVTSIRTKTVHLPS